MKKLYFYIFCVLAIVFIYGCNKDEYYESTRGHIIEIKIINHSSFDLHIEFIANEYQSQCNPVEIEKNETVAFNVSNRHTYMAKPDHEAEIAPPHPNSFINSIIVSHLVSKEIILEVNDIDPYNNPIFEYSWYDSSTNTSSYYYLNITDELLEMEDK